MTAPPSTQANNYPQASPELLSPKNGQYLEAAARIGNQLYKDALWSKDSATWMTWAMEPFNGQWVNLYRNGNVSFYDGLPGIGFFMAHLYSQTQDPKHKKGALGAMQGTLYLAKDKKDLPGSFYTGYLGMGYALCQAGVLLQEQEWVQKGQAFVQKSFETKYQGNDIDMIAGPAGNIPVLLDLAQQFNKPQWKEQALMQGRVILKHAKKSAEGISWDGAITRQRNLLGFAHGNAGFINALLALYNASQDQEFLTTAQEALRYERTFFDAQQSNWPDFRTDPSSGPNPQPAFPIAWCHGATGIGLGRLRVLELLPNDTQTGAEIDAANRTVNNNMLQTAANPTPLDFTYCHGQAGNIELMLENALQFNRKDFRDLAENAARHGMTAYLDQDIPWPCGVANAGQTPGFMTGIAGIGYMYLRLYNAVQHPGILLYRNSLVQTP